MLRSFRFANHKSFRDEAELLLVPAYDKSRPVVPVVAVFGANASGKSNLLDALRWVQVGVLDSYRAWLPQTGVPRFPFQLDPGATMRPSGFCVEVTIDGVRYSYGIEVDDDHVIEEWLYAYPRNRRRVVFERSDRVIRLGSTISDYRGRGEMLAKNTRGNAVFLTVAAFNNLAEVQPVFRWFQTGLVFASHDGELADESLTHLLAGEDRDRAVALVQAADLGITNITVRQSVSLTAELLDQLVADGSLKLKRAGEPFQESEQRLAASEIAGRYAIDADAVLGSLHKLPNADAIPRHQQLLFEHGSQGAFLSLYDQSAGTKSWMNLVVHALRALERGGLLVVDEVDASLHPHLTSRLINLFRDTETNQRHAQLLLTTHDATLLDDETLARDEIWFVEKDPGTGNSVLFPLTDFHPRKNENTEGRYLAGGYGAVPLLTHARFRKALEKGQATGAAA